MFLSYDDPQSTGNNAYLQNRTKVDPRFRLSAGRQADLSNIKGYSATGELMTNRGTVDTTTRSFSSAESYHEPVPKEVPDTGDAEARAFADAMAHVARSKTRKHTKSRSGASKRVSNYLW